MPSMCWRPGRPMSPTCAISATPRAANEVRPRRGADRRRGGADRRPQPRRITAFGTRARHHRRSRSSRPIRRHRLWLAAARSRRRRSRWRRRTARPSWCRRCCKARATLDTRLNDTTTQEKGLDAARRLCADAPEARRSTSRSTAQPAAPRDGAVRLTPSLGNWTPASTSCQQRRCRRCGAPPPVRARPCGAAGHGRAASRSTRRSGPCAGHAGRSRRAAPE